jgi:hypothetical protein
MRSFYDIARRHGTDKVTDHVYDRHYEHHLAYLREERFAMLEVGVWDGRSMRVWSEYFPLAEIHGVDKDARALGTYDGPAVIHVCDVMDDEMEEVARHLPSLRLVIDDGGHHMRQQQRAMELLWPRLEPGGWYVIEDLQISRPRPCFAEKLGGAARRLMKGEGGRQRPRDEKGWEPADIAEMHCYWEICFLRRASAEHASRKPTSKPPGAWDWDGKKPL